MRPIRYGLLAACLMVVALSTGLEAQATRSPLRSTLLSAATTGTSPAVDVQGFPNLTVYVRGSGTISSGVITIEEADVIPGSEATYSGTWSAVTTITASGATGGAQVATHLPAPSAYAHLRARITTTIGGGGSVTVVLRGN